jgi:hypothetical protein
VGDGTVSYVEKSNTTYGGTISSDAANPGSITAVTNASGHVTFQAGDNETQDYTIQQSSVQIGNGSPTVTGSETFTSVDGGDTNGPITTSTLSGFSQDILGFTPPEFNAGYSNHINQVIGGTGYAYQIGSPPAPPSAPTLLSTAFHGVVNFLEGKDNVLQSIGNAISNAYWGLGSFLVNNPYAKYIPVLGSITSMVRVR